jgi:ATP-dependent Clp protease ATP-binding subunit ClpA
MLSQELEVSLHMTFTDAGQLRHQFITVEHLLLGLLDNPSATEVLHSCSANINELRTSLSNFIKESVQPVAGTDKVEPQPTVGFQRVINRAIVHVQSMNSNKKDKKDNREVTGADVLLSIFSEKDSYAVRCLQRQEIMRLLVVNFMTHGIKKVSSVAYKWTEDEETTLLSGLVEEDKEKVKLFLAEHRQK